MGSGSSSRAAERLGVGRVVAIGLTGLAIMLALTTTWERQTGAVVLALWFLGLALTMGWVMAPATSAVVGAVPAAKSGIASATNTVARMVSGALGVAVIGSLVSSLYSNDVHDATAGLAPGAQAQAADSIGAASTIAARLPGDLGSGLLTAAGDAFTNAMGVALLIAAGLAAATAVVVLRGLRGSRVSAPAGVEPPLTAPGRASIDLQPLH
jgi:MFS transporter, DHA2 family, multidrug resistance protein